MKKLVLTTAVAAAMLLSACDSGPFASAEAIRTRATQNLTQKNFTEAAKTAEELVKKTPDAYDGYYLAAQARAQLGDKNAALAALESAIKKGLKDDKEIVNNANLQPLLNMAAFSELMDSSFPKREKTILSAGGSNGAGGAVGISETRDKTVIRAGDVVVELPKD
ncbi:tetratricopeptide repeat protein [Rugamonas sp. DEMB1]|uniref:tetratricopeptide repeat protein n=1 Tax=Rugamonas sp. DEMB1 TaxID=3039386 RepID=UPI00244A981B|nr:tetratricopeptide repeat protein [Rugamonas sp. DEMB1]WGG52415.1 tetratricopeptide repeat protein [Rugamonas sp. DEMB1]